MPDPKRYNLDFRPSTYFPIDRPKQKELVLVDIEDPLIRAVVSFLQEEGEGADRRSGVESKTHPPTSDQERAALTAGPPTFFGGCCLPGLREAEVEIARIHLESTTFDIISVRARLEGGKFSYSVVDEYEGQIEYTCNPEVSDQPLTMAEFIDLMEKTEVNSEYTGLVLGMLQHNFENSGDPESWCHFASVSSETYPELAAWYEDAKEEWLELNQGTTARNGREGASNGE
jgi:hypothetical protein